jgi:hypothetical protein
MVAAKMASSRHDWGVTPSGGGVNATPSATATTTAHLMRSVRPDAFAPAGPCGEGESGGVGVSSIRVVRLTAF